MEKMAEILQSSMSEVFAKSSKPEERRRTEELKREKNEIEGSKPWNDITKPKPEVKESGSDREPLNGQTATEAQREEDLPEDSLSQATESGVTMTATSLLIDLGEISLSLSCVTDWCDREEVDEKRGKSEEGPGERRRDGRKPPWEMPECAVTVAEMVRLPRDLGFVLGVAACDWEERKEKEIWAESFAKKVDHAVINLGQAQVLVSKSDPFHIGRGVLKETEKEKKVFWVW